MMRSAKLTGGDEGPGAGTPAAVPRATCPRPRHVRAGARVLFG